MSNWPIRPQKTVRKFTEEHKKNLCLSMTEERKKQMSLDLSLRNKLNKDPTGLRDKFDRILVDHSCPVCGEKRLLLRSYQSSGQHLLCHKCAAKKRDRKYIELNGHGRNYNGSKYFSGRIIWQWKNNARDRNYEWCISYEYLDSLYEKQHGKCVFTGEKLSFDEGNPNKVSLDRIDSNLGYTEDNVQLVATVINRMKRDYDDNMFIKLCNLVARENPMDLGG